MTDDHPATRLILMLSESWTLVDARDVRGLAELAAVAERTGVDGVLVGEHVVLGAEADAVGPAPNPREWVGPHNQTAHYPYHNPLHVLTAMAALTTSIRLVASALLSPLRHPLTLGKELVTLDLMSRGRLVYMPAPGTFRDEYAAVGVDHARRGELLDEQLEIWARAWHDERVSYHGRHYAFDDIAFEPKPWRPDGPVLWIGGRRLHPRALRRTVRHAAGYFPVVPPSDDEIGQLSDALGAAGRSLSDIELVGFIGMATPFPQDGGPKALEPQLDAIVPQLERGMSTFVVKPSQYIDDASDFEAFCHDAVSGLRARAG